MECMYVCTYINDDRQTDRPIGYEHHTTTMNPPLKDARTISSGSYKPTPSATAAAMSVILRASIEPRHLLRSKLCREIDRRLAMAEFLEAHATGRMEARALGHWNPATPDLRGIPALTVVHARVPRLASNPPIRHKGLAPVDDTQNGWFCW